MKRTYTKEEVQQAVDKSQCYSDVFRYFNVTINGGSYSWLKRLIQDFNISTQHFLSGEELFKKNHFNASKNYTGQVELKSTQRLRAKKLKKFMLDNKILYCCNVCKLTLWNNKQIVLDIDHIDENCLNNSLENLQFLCPNCHRQK